MLISSDPFEPDTDFDGIPDGLEIRGTNAWACRTNPRQDDSDSDGLTDVQETHANPCQSDTDDDGLRDGDEVLRYETNPLNADHDGDGLKDGVELGCDPRQKGPCPPQPQPNGFCENQWKCASMVLGIVVLGYFGLTYLKVSSTVKQIESDYRLALVMTG